MSEILNKVAKAMNPATTRVEEVTGVSNNPELTNAFNQEQAEHAQRATIEINSVTNGVREEIKDLFWNAPQNFARKFAKRMTRIVLKPIPWAVLKLKGKIIDFPVKTAIGGVLAAVTKVLNWADMPFVKVSEISDKLTGDGKNGPMAA